MTSMELATMNKPAPEVLASIERAMKMIGDLDAPHSYSVRRDASIVEAAAQRAGAEDLQLAAARLRLYAERRIGELLNMPGNAEVVCSSKERAEWARLARIPRTYRRVNPVWAMGKITGAVEPAQPQYEQVDLFEMAVEYQLNASRSHTAYSVYRRSLSMSIKKTRYPWLWETWLGTWEFTYPDPRTKRPRRGSCDGAMNDALTERARLAGRISASTTALQPVRGQDPLASVLDSVRAAREALGEQWPGLSQEQKASLDGVYSHLDDVAIALVTAVNL